MKATFNPLLLIVLLIFALSCTHEPLFFGESPERIQVGPGPEDMVIDSLFGPARLLVSCMGRREEHKPYGEIISYEFHSGIQKTMIRFNEPDDLKFKPHGIYLERDLLYVISHEKEPDYHPILIYRVHGDSLEFLELIHTPDLHSPNALVTGAGGEIYFVNDSGKRGSLAEKILKLKRASVVKLNKDDQGSWQSQVVAEKLGYPAGINRIGSKLFVGDAILNQIHVYTISEDGLQAENEFKNLKGNDNIRIFKNRLLTPGHTKAFKFIKHAKDPLKYSPVEVYLVNPENGEYETLFSTDGSLISGGSTALIFENHLYINQVFDPFILKVKL